MDELNRIIEALREWGRGQKEPFAHYGICGNLAHIRTLSKATIYSLRGKAFCNLLDEAFSSWPNYSGNRAFPIHDPEAPSNPFAARPIYYAHETLSLWEDSPYGNLRRELCLHLADWLEANKPKILPLFEEKPHD